MPITATAAPAKIIVDCIQFSTATNEPPVEQLITWVRSVPTASPVHVTLRNALLIHGGRRLQSTLQALGCTVTMETKIAESL